MRNEVRKRSKLEDRKNDSKAKSFFFTSFLFSIEYVKMKVANLI